ncbi:unnamed protein product [Cladocopium goreaui]|uniref:Uncharacterized protein n=1 Tax=Cladocopium goreaui TaxID=2562237 RepID=A0A9P1CXM8_9DINO|nr:unnamed protein product [Cladocopium goreaui]
MGPQALERVLKRLIFLGAPKAFILVILLASWQTFSPYSEGAQYEVIEYYAGVGRIARLSSACGYQSTAYDVLYQPGPSNAATGPGPGCGLALHLLMQGKFSELLTFWGICCSSWIHLNSGTSKRDYATPMGCDVPSVVLANLLTSRSCFLILFVICMEGVPVVENPGSSLIWLHDRFQWLLTLLERAGLKMYRQSFWMRGFDHFSMKRTILWSTSPAIIAFMQFAHFKGKKDKSPASKSTTRRYINRWGEVAYHGTRDLKRTQIYTPKFASFVVRLVPKLHERKQKFPEVLWLYIIRGIGELFQIKIVW